MVAVPKPRGRRVSSHLGTSPVHCSYSTPHLSRVTGPHARLPETGGGGGGVISWLRFKTGFTFSSPYWLKLRSNANRFVYLFNISRRTVPAQYFNHTQLYSGLQKDFPPKSDFITSSIGEKIFRDLRRKDNTSLADFSIFSQYVYTIGIYILRRFKKETLECFKPEYFLQIAYLEELARESVIYTSKIKSIGCPSSRRLPLLVIRTYGHNWQFGGWIQGSILTRV